MKQCKNCGKILEENEIFCQSCGQKYEEEMVNEAPVMSAVAPEVSEPITEVAPVVQELPTMTVEQAPVMEAVSIAPEVESMPAPEVVPVAQEQPTMTVEQAPVMEAVSAAPEVESMPAPEVAPVVQEQPTMTVEQAPVMEAVSTAPEVESMPAPEVAPVVQEQPAMTVEQAPIMEPVSAAPEVESIPAPEVAPVVQESINNQVVNNVQPDSKKGNKNLIFIILAVILVLIILGLGVFIIIKIVSNNNSKIVKDYQPYTTTTVSGSNVSNSNTFTSGGYTFTLPEGLYHTMESNLNAVYDSSKSFAVAFQVSYYDYESLKNNPASFADDLKQKSNMNVNGYKVNNHSGREYVEIDVEYSGSEAKYIFSKMDDNKVAFGAVMVQSTTFDNALDKFTTVLNSGKRSSGDSTQDFSISTEEQDIPNFIEAIK